MMLSYYKATESVTSTLVEPDSFTRGFSRSSHCSASWGPSVQSCEPMEPFHIQITTAIPWKSITTLRMPLPVEQYDNLESYLHKELKKKGSYYLGRKMPPTSCLEMLIFEQTPEHFQYCRTSATDKPMH